MILPRFAAVLFPIYIITYKADMSSSQQIYYKAIGSSLIGGPGSEILYDPLHNIYPVIYVPESCPFIPIKSCDNGAFYWKQFEKRCRVSSYCPNSTHVQCVENRASPWKDVRLVCGPIGKCDRATRYIVYFDKSKPNIYLLGKKMCDDGRYQANSKYCFGDCIKDKRLQILQASTSTSPAKAYCNYHMGYCNAKGPTIFNLTNDQNPCYLDLNGGHQPCLPRTERLPDCSCSEWCPENYIRNASNDFKCEFMSQLRSSTDDFSGKLDIHAQQVDDGLRLKWNFLVGNTYCVKTLKITYRKAGRTRNTSLDNIVPKTCNGYPEYTDIEPLFPGQTYDITVQINYSHADNLRNITVQRAVTTRPKAVDNLTASFDADNVEIQWNTPKGSKQDHYLLQHREVRRNRKPSWRYNTTHFCNFTLQHPFPGEEYEIHVSSISSSIYSRVRATSIIIPPLPPDTLHVHFPSPYRADVILFWFKNDTRSHVERWILICNSSNGDSNQIDIQLPDDGNRVQAPLLDLRRGNTYTIYVYSLVDAVYSAKPVQTEFKMPYIEVKGQGVHTAIWIILGILVVICVAIGVVVVIVLHLFKKDKQEPLIRRIRNYFNVDRLDVDVNNDIGDLNIPLGDVLKASLNNNDAILENSSDSEDR